MCLKSTDYTMKDIYIYIKDVKKSSIQLLRVDKWNKV